MVSCVIGNIMYLDFDGFKYVLVYVCNRNVAHFEVSCFGMDKILCIDCVLMCYMHKLAWPFLMLNVRLILVESGTSCIIQIHVQF